MSKKVLIAYGSRFGCTKEVSQKIGNILKDQGIEPEIVNLRKTKSKNWPKLDQFDGVLIGSGIKIGRWTKEPKSFMKKNKDVLNSTKVGMFVCSGAAAVDKNHAQKEYLEKVMNEVGVKAQVYDAFGGVMDLSEDSPLGFLDKKMLKTGAKEMTKDSGIEIKDGEKTDFRDWDQITKFAQEFARLVKK
ncbi:MAG: flavodoxin domain-containing protein [Candidatus Methanofastidiosia archaeon]|jgi:menaquinone-dependent protoporphyrinogen oxidase